MDNKNLLERITINPKVMVGKPVIQGTRLTVEFILGLLAHGTTMKEILEEYPGLAKDDIYACLLFTSKTLQELVRYERSMVGDNSFIHLCHSV